MIAAYGHGDPLILALWACGLLALWCWLASITTGNYSQVDRLWSIAPPLYAVHFAAHAGCADTRLNLMALLVVAWGLRLTYNYARKGGYRRGSEDYRWEVLRRTMGPRAFQLFNATFLAPFQNLLLLLLVLPAHVAAQEGGAPLSALDAAATVLFGLFWVGEAVADQQQWRFQSAKQAKRSRGEPVEAEFLTTGLFRYSRHPNFLCEQGMWWSFYLFSVAATGAWVNRSVVGAALLTLLFHGSTRLTERLTLERYPEYRDYQRTTPQLIPLRVIKLRKH